VSGFCIKQLQAVHGATHPAEQHPSEKDDENAEGGA